MSDEREPLFISDFRPQVTVTCPKCGTQIINHDGAFRAPDCPPYCPQSAKRDDTAGDGPVTDPL